MGVPFTKSKIPVVERRVTKQSACDASQKTVTFTALPNGLGMLYGSVSCASRYCSSHVYSANDISAIRNLIRASVVCYWKLTVDSPRWEIGTILDTLCTACATFKQVFSFTVFASGHLRKSRVRTRTILKLNWINRFEAIGGGVFTHLSLTHTGLSNKCSVHNGQIIGLPRWSAHSLDRTVKVQLRRYHSVRRFN
jgi:hypothetical protein